MKVLVSENDLKNWVKRGDILRDHALKLDDLATRIFTTYSAKVTNLVKLDQRQPYLSEKAWDAIHGAVRDLEALQQELQGLRTDIMNTLKGESGRES